ncbi:MAG TPA: [FeFe] hydrogenase H-cluster maturation GTPase HydF [Oscillospiraceae bacterium]|nr:[FeFe] hydrogenase H-cluster maturation GTPase HydF [Oscillospiraceae bacterium]
MVSEINNTPKALRLHIGVFGSTNAGKSTLINLISGQEISLTSPIAGTTTDPVFKPMELLPLGPVVFIDTAGLDDNTELGTLRMKKTYAQLEACDAVIFVVSSEESDLERIKKHIERIKKMQLPLIIIVNKMGEKEPGFSLTDYSQNVICVDLSLKSSADKIKKMLVSVLEDKIEEPPLTADLVKNGDVVLLIAPQDIQAPKGRLILPEVQTIRDLLDNECIVMSITSNNIQKALDSLSQKPSLVITDSQLYKKVSESIPKDIRLTSFSMLMAKNKADIVRLVNGARAIDKLSDGDKVMILESCSHHPMEGDIARQQIPALLRKYTGKKLEIVNVSGQLITENISEYKLAIHCGGCMVNRKAMLSKQQKFEDSGVPLTNFGVAIAYMNGIIDRVCY